MLDKALIPSPTKVQVLYWLEKWNELSDLIYDLTSKFDEDEYDEEQIEKAFCWKL